MPLVERCHDRVREMSAHVVTTIKIEEDEGAIGKLASNVRTVEEKPGRKLGRAEAIVTTKAEAEARASAGEDLSIGKD